MGARPAHVGSVTGVGGGRGSRQLFGGRASPRAGAIGDQPIGADVGSDPGDSAVRTRWQDSAAHGRGARHPRRRAPPHPGRRDIAGARREHLLRYRARTHARGRRDVP